MKFSIECILSITHDKLLCKIDDVYKILNYLTGDNLYTHQLPRAAKVCKVEILKQYPQLCEWGDKIDFTIGEQIDETNYMYFTEEARRMFGDFLEISKNSNLIFEKINPIQEIINIRKEISYV